MTHMRNKLNDYAMAAGPDVFEAAPKAVWAALAISFGTTGGDHIDNARKLILDEWQVLIDNGIVEQKIPSRLRAEESRT